MQPPLDHPTPGRAHRVYLTLTNHCNRACPWCCTHSSPAGRSWLDPGRVAAHIPAQGQFQLQLEGGEPTLHPRLSEFVAIARDHPRCERLVLCSNGVAIPHDSARLRGWLLGFGERFTLKLSINHHLLERDHRLIDLACTVRGVLEELGDGRLLVLNVRLRKGVADDDRAIRERIEAAGLAACANIFFLQRYGLAEGEEGWEPPYLAGHNFTLVNPDGRAFGTDLLARSAAMRGLD